MKNKLFIASVAILIIIYAGYLIVVNNKKIAPEIKTIRVGMAVGLTGYAAEWGEGELGAVKAVFDSFNSSQNNIKIDLVVQDTKTDGLGTTNAIKQLVEIHKVDLIIGPTWGDSFQGGHSISNKAGIWSISPSTSISALGKDKELYPYLLSTWWRQDSEIRTLQKYMIDHGIRTVAIVSDKDGYNAGFVSDFAKAAPSLGISIVMNESLPIGTTDFRTVISKARLIRPDGLLILLQDTSQVGPFSKQLRELGIANNNGTPTSIFSTSFVESYTNLKTFPGMFDGLTYAFPKIVEDDKYKMYLEKYQSENPEKATGSSFVPALNAAQAVVEVIVIREKTMSGVGTIPLDKVDMKGVGIERVRFDESGQLSENLFEMKTVINNTFQLVQ